MNISLRTWIQVQLTILINWTRVQAQILKKKIVKWTIFQNSKRRVSFKNQILANIKLPEEAPESFDGGRNADERWRRGGSSSAGTGRQLWRRGAGELENKKKIFLRDRSDSATLQLVRNSIGNEENAITRFLLLFIFHAIANKLQCN